MYILNATQCFFASLLFSLAVVGLAALVSLSFRHKMKQRPGLTAALVLLVALAAMAGGGKQPADPPAKARLRMLEHPHSPTNAPVFLLIDFEIKEVAQ
ncbi:MAG: hypothetical protein ACOX9C_04475 [Kiritimatiellia bacterium]|jgi:hypothetical protein